ncbi:hypothetical protein QTP86_023368, partial [Hemibagrus guttatus]
TGLGLLGPFIHSLSTAYPIYTRVMGSLCLSQASLGIKAGYTLDGVPTHRRAHTHTLSFTHTITHYGQFRDANQPTMHVFGAGHLGPVKGNCNAPAYIIYNFVSTPLCLNSVIDCFGLSVFKMAALVSSTREVFSEAVRAVLETWPVLQIAVDNGFGGVYSQQKADWMVDAVQQYFHDNSDLEQDEVEDFLSELMNNEFDTMVDDGSLPQVAQKVCVLFQQCKQGKLAEVRQQMSQLALKKASGRAKVTPVKSPTEDAEGSNNDDDEVSMECDEAGVGASASSTALKQQQASSSAPKEEEEEEDGWTVVRRKK